MVTRTKKRQKRVDVGVEAEKQPAMARPELTRTETMRTILCLKSWVRSLGSGGDTYSEQELIKEYKVLIGKLDGALMKAEGGALAMEMRFVSNTLAVAAK